MEKSNLINTLRTFGKKELREFRKWLLSPAHNQREDVVALFDYLMAGGHLFSEKHLAKPTAFRTVYPDKTFSDAEMRQVMHFLFKTVEDFLVHQELLKDQVKRQATLAKVYRERQLSKLFKRSMDNGRREQKAQPHRNVHYFENEILLQYENYAYLSVQGRNVPLNLQELADANDVAYLANKLRLASLMLSHQAVFKTEYQFHLLDDLLRFVEGHPDYLDIPAISLYYYIFKSISEKDSEAHFHELKKRIQKHSTLFPTDEMRGIILLAINYCIGRINAGNLSFYQETFDLFDHGLKGNILLENRILSRFSFNNAVISGLNMGRFEWVEKTIVEQSQYLEVKYRESYVQFYRARLHFERKEYGEAMRLFAQYENDDILMSLHAKTMLIKMYYELDEFIALDSLIASMQAYIQRKKVMGYHRNVFKNLLSSMKKILKVMPNDREQVANLIEEVKATEPLMERKWLLEQLEKM